jgi:hypothetical protein
VILRINVNSEHNTLLSGSAPKNGAEDLFRSWWNICGGADPAIDGASADPHPNVASLPYDVRKTQEGI